MDLMLFDKGIQMFYINLMSTKPQIKINKCKYFILECCILLFGKLFEIIVIIIIWKLLWHNWEYVNLNVIFKQNITNFMIYLWFINVLKIKKILQHHISNNEPQADCCCYGNFLWWIKFSRNGKINTLN